MDVHYFSFYYLPSHSTSQSQFPSYKTGRAGQEGSLSIANSVHVRAPLTSQVLDQELGHKDPSKPVWLSRCVGVREGGRS